MITYISIFRCTHKYEYDVVFYESYLDGYLHRIRIAYSTNKSQAVPALKQIAGLHQARKAHHLSYGSDTGSNSGGRRKTKKNVYA